MTYGPSYWQAREVGADCRKLTYNRVLDTLERRLPPGAEKRLVDVGSGEGGLLDRAFVRGWLAVGVDPYAPKLPGVVQATLVNALRDWNEWDAVTMVDVLEHLDDPKTELREVWRLLRHGGTVYLLTPDAGGLAARWLGRHWWERKSEHVTLYDRDSLTVLLTGMGFVEVRTRIVGKTLSLAYVAAILAKDRHPLARPVRWLSRLYPWPIRFPWGFVEATGVKP